MKISARNVLPGTVKAIVKGPVSTEVELELAPGLVVVASITTTSANQLDLKVGDSAFGIIKASSVMVGVAD